MANAPAWSHSSSREEKNGNPNGSSELDADMISAVSDFSGLDDIMFAHQEEAPVITRFSHIPEFPELLPEVRAELQEIQAAMDAARATRKIGTAGGDAISVDGVPAEAEPVVAVLFELPDDGAGISVTEPVADAVRAIQFNALKSEIFRILSEDGEFPAYHVKSILDLSGKVSVWTPESELADIGTLLLYLSETLWVFFDRESQWEDHKHSYVSSAARSPKTKFRLRAIRLISEPGTEKKADDSEILRAAKATFGRDYDRWRQRFSILMKRNGAESITAFRTDFSAKPYGRTAERCLEAGFALWKDIFLENRRIRAELTKIRGSVLLRKIRRIEKEFDFSDIERQEELEAARLGVYRPKKRKKKGGGLPIAGPILESGWSA